MVLFLLADNVLGCIVHTGDNLQKTADLLCFRIKTIVNVFLYSHLHFKCYQKSRWALLKGYVQFFQPALDIPHSFQCIPMQELFSQNIFEGWSCPIEIDWHEGIKGYLLYFTTWALFSHLRWHFWFLKRFLSGIMDHAAKMTQFFPH